ncbi:MAG: hypothetical protein GX946_07800 [Oligosphaeraceae bacterium]|nr:hypothetical protein [Oligosphaeraceae bacterium]
MSALMILGNLFQIAILTLVFYWILRFLKGTPSILMLGVLIIVFPALYFFTNRLNLQVLHWLIERMLALMPIFLIVVFKEDIRRILTFLGKQRFRTFRRLNTANKQRRILAMIDELIDCVCALTAQPHWVWPKGSETGSRSRGKHVRYNTGALIAVENAPRLNEYIEKGVRIDAKLSSLILQTIFYKGTPLHDGGVIIRKGNIVAAACQFPAASHSENRPIHTRHNAAIGLSEQVPDITVIVVSEETGNVSVTTGPGRLELMENPRHFRNVLCNRLGVSEIALEDEPHKKSKMSESIWNRLLNRTESWDNPMEEPPPETEDSNKIEE